MSVLWVTRLETIYAETLIRRALWAKSRLPCVYALLGFEIQWGTRAQLDLVTHKSESVLLLRRLWRAAVTYLRVATEVNVVINVNLKFVSQFPAVPGTTRAYPISSTRALSVLIVTHGRKRIRIRVLKIAQHTSTQVISYHEVVVY